MQKPKASFLHIFFYLILSTAIAIMYKNSTIYTNSQICFNGHQANTENVRYSQSLTTHIISNLST